MINHNTHSNNFRDICLVLLLMTRRSLAKEKKRKKKNLYLVTEMELENQPVSAEIWPIGESISLGYRVRKQIIDPPSTRHWS